MVASEEIVTMGNAIGNYIGHRAREPVDELIIRERVEQYKPKLPSEIVSLIDQLIFERRRIINELEVLKSKVEEHQGRCNIAEGVGAATTLVGGVGTVVTGGLFPAVVVVGSCLSIGSTVADIFKSEEFYEKITSIANSQKVIAEQLTEKLEELKEVATKITEDKSSDERTAIKDTLYFMCGVGALVVITKMAFTISSLIALVLGVLILLGSIWQVVDVIMSWKTEHPAVTKIDSLIRDIQSGNTELKCLRTRLELPQGS